MTMFLLSLGLSALVLPLVVVKLYVLYYLFSLPLRRQERARLFLDLIEMGLRQGRGLEPTVLAVAASGDQSLGRGFRQFAARLAEGQALTQALRQGPAWLPRPVVAMLQAGHEAGDLAKLLPACRQHLKDALGRVATAHHYLMTLAFVVTPAAAMVFSLLTVFVLPKLLVIERDMAADFAGLLNGFAAQSRLILVGLWSLVALFDFAALLYIAGPRLTRPLAKLAPPVAAWLGRCGPWRQKRRQRDFTAVLAALLDAGVPEARAVTLAAAGTAQAAFQKRALTAVTGLSRGLSVHEALGELDRSGELEWRLANAARGRGGFTAALTGWQEALDAQAFQQEQTAVQLLTSALVLANGLFVGLLAAGVFQVLIHVTGEGLLW